MVVSTKNTQTAAMPRPVATPVRCVCPVSTGQPPIFGHLEYGQMADANHGLAKLHLFWAPQLDAILSRHGY